MDKKIIIATILMLLTVPLAAANDYIIQDSNGNNLFVVNSTGEVTVENGNLNLGGNSLESATVPWSTLNNYPSGCDPDEAINQVGDTVDCVALDAGGVVNTTGGAQNEISFFLNNDTVTSDSQLYWDSSNNELGVGIANPSKALDVSGGAEFTGTINLNTNQITGLEDPDNAQDAATKSYVETYADNNDNTGTDNQTLSTTADTSGTDDSITISNGNTITVDDDYAADDQNLGTNGNQITLDNGGSIVVPYANNADTVDGNQPSDLTWSNLGVDQSDVSVSDLGAADSNINMNSFKIVGLQDPDNAQDAATKSFVETYADNNDRTGTDDQNLQSTTRTGSTVTIPLEDGGTTTFNDQYEANTDTQDLSVDSSSQDDVISLDNGGSITIDDDTTSNTDEQVAVDSTSAPGYLGSSNDGVLRPNSELSYVDNGDYITLGVQASNINHDSLSNIDYNDHHGVGSGIRWDGSNDIALDANDLDNNGNINDFSAASDLNSNGDISSFDNANDLKSSGDIADNSVENAELNLNTLDVSGGSAGDGSQSGLTVDSDGNLYFSGSLNFPGDVNTVSQQELDGSFVPSQDATFNIGGTSTKWKNAYLSDSLIIGSTDLSEADLDALDNGVINDGEVSNSITVGTAGTVQAEAITSEGASSGQVLQWDGSNWVPATDNYEADTDAQSQCGNDQVLTGQGCESKYDSVDDGDKSSSNEIQDPTVTANDDQITVNLNNGGGQDSATITDDNTQLDDVQPTSNVNMNGQKITNLAPPTNANDAVRQQDVSGEYVDIDGDTMNGNLSLNNNQLQDVGGTDCGDNEALLGDGTCGSTASTLSTVMSNGNSASTDLDMNGNNITDSSKGNVTIGQDLKVHGKLWLPGEGSSFNPDLSTVTGNGNTVGGNNINFDQNSNIQSSGTNAITFDSNQNVGIPNGNLDLAGNNLTSTSEICAGNACNS